MKIKQLLIFLFPLLLLASCSSEKEKYMNDWKQLIEKVETNQKMTGNELKAASAEYERLNEQLTKIYNDLTPEERKEVGKMEARYLKAYASQTTNDFIKGLEGLFDVADGFIKEFTNGEDKNPLNIGSLNELIGKIDSSSLNKLAKSVNEKQIEQILSKIDTTQVNNIVTGLAAIGATLTGNTLTQEDIKKLKQNISKENIEQLKNSITKEDIEVLKQSITADDIKMLKESLTPEEIQKLKKAYQSINK